METALLVHGKDILNYIPQGHPIVLVHELIECADNAATTGLFVSDCDPMFIENGCLLESGLVEHMAQSCALQAGYAPTMKPSREREEPRVGFIAEVKSLQIYHLPKKGQHLITTVEMTGQVMGITMVDCRTQDENGLVCTCEMRIFQTAGA